MEVLVQPARLVQGKINVPGDKSISHRALILGALSEGRTEITGLLESADVRSTWSCLEALGISIQNEGGKVSVLGKGPQGFRAPREHLQCGNSGTTLRLLTGLLAGQRFSSTLTGDPSLSQR